LDGGSFYAFYITGLDSYLSFTTTKYSTTRSNLAGRTQLPLAIGVPEYYNGADNMGFSDPKKKWANPIFN
jgi:hypothetical protein